MSGEVVCEYECLAEQHRFAGGGERVDERGGDGRFACGGVFMNDQHVQQIGDVRGGERAGREWQQANADGSAVLGVDGACEQSRPGPCRRVGAADWFGCDALSEPPVAEMTVVVAGGLRDERLGGELVTEHRRGA